MNVSTLRAARLVAAKDLRIERHSRVALAQMLPFGLLVLLMFAFALDPNRQVLTSATPGIFWMTVLFMSTLAVQRAFAVETQDSAMDSLRLTGITPAAIFLGKMGALLVQLLLLEVVLAVGVAILYSTTLSGWLMLLTVTLLSTIGISAAGATYGVLVSRLRHSSTLLPLLLLPLLAPVLIAATKGTEQALGTEAASGSSWVVLLAVFAAAYTALGVLLYRPLLEET